MRVMSVPVTIEIIVRGGISCGDDGRLLVDIETDGRRKMKRSSENLKLNILAENVNV